jgi:glyoxylase-like metal-dependent hydrolase (beta-lactamase superfamily II)
MIRRLAIASLFVLAGLALLDAQQPPAVTGARATAPTAAGSGQIHVQHIRGNVSMLVGPNTNVTVQTGPDGVVLVDSMDAASAEPLFAAIRTLSDKPINTIIDTHFHVDHTGGNEALAKLGCCGPQAVRIMAHERVLNRFTASAGSGTESTARLQLNAVITLPINSEYFTPTKDFSLNDEAIILQHVPAAHTDGDTLVFFRSSDVLAVGDIFWPDQYPFIDLQAGGSVNGLIDALNKVLEITVPRRFQEGGTYVVPGHGRLCDEADVVEYRDMVTIVRDRVQDLIKKGQSWQQIKAARPSRDYDLEYGTASGDSTPEKFVEAVYRSLGGK